MARYLIIKLQGLFQAWGGHTFETYRPTELFPTRSGVTGLLGACLGLRRNEKEALANLNRSYSYAVRRDKSPYPATRMVDFHTVQNVRTVKSGPKETEITRREYLEDTSFTLALWQSEKAAYDLGRLGETLQRPELTPYLGRRSCPLGRPLFETYLLASSFDEALRAVDPGSGTIYSEEKPTQDAVAMRIRDLPIAGSRQFETRLVYVYVAGEGAHDVP